MKPPLGDVLETDFIPAIGPSFTPSSGRIKGPIRRRAKSFFGCASGLILAAILGLAMPGCAAHPPSGPTIGALQPNSFNRTWNQDLQLKHDRVIHLYLRDELLFVYTASGNCYAIDRTSGQLVMATAVPVPGEKLKPPVVLNDMIVYPTATELFLYDKHGRPLRKVSLRYPASSGLIGGGVMVYYGARSPYGPRVVGLDVSQNPSFVKWNYLTKGDIPGAPALFANLLYTGSLDGSIAGVNIDDGGAIWTTPQNLFRTYDAIDADIKADEYGVYIASTDSKLYCVDRTTGKIRWQYFADVALTRAPWVTPTAVYQPLDHSIVAIDKRASDYNRKAQWVVHNVQQFLAEDEKNVYFEQASASAGGGHRLLAFDKATGKKQFQSKTSQFDLFAPNVPHAKFATDVIYAATVSGQISAISPVLKAGTAGEMVQAMPQGPAVADASSAAPAAP